jgi:hypothetical protein
MVPLSRFVCALATIALSRTIASAMTLHRFMTTSTINTDDSVQVLTVRKLRAERVSTKHTRCHLPQVLPVKLLRTKDRQKLSTFGN